VQEFFVTSAWFIIHFPDEDFDSYINGMDHRINFDDDTYGKPDFCKEKTIIEYDGNYYHLDCMEADSNQTAHYLQAGI
jgi:hypothetical protein